MIQVGLKFKQTFPSNIAQFEVVDIKNGMVITQVTTKGGYKFNDSIEQEYLENAFAIKEYEVI